NAGASPPRAGPGASGEPATRRRRAQCASGPRAGSGADRPAAHRLKRAECSLWTQCSCERLLVSSSPMVQRRAWKRDAMVADNATTADESLDEITDALMTASRLLVAISARSIGLVDETITIPQFRTLVIL